MLTQVARKPRSVATGNWGCGAFKGDPQLKAFLQWAAASRAQVPSLLYYTFGNQQVDQVSLGTVFQVECKICN